MTAPRVIGVVLAGGASTRFGADKLAVDVGGRPLLHRSVDALAAVADHVIVVIGPDAAIPSLPAGLIGRVSIARDPVAYGGPLAGLAAGLQAAVATTGGDPRTIALVVGGDMPTLVSGVLRLLAEALDGDEALVAMTLAASEDPPLPMAIRPGAVAAAEELLLAGRRSLRGLLAAVPSATVPEPTWRTLDPDGQTLRDIDRPGDIDALA